MLNDNHRRSLMSRLQVLDQSLAEALQKLEPPDEERIYRGVLPDVTLAQRKALRDYLAQLRFAMRRFIQRHELSDSMRPMSGLKVFNIALNFALISVEELRPSYLRGYGQVDENSAADLERFSAELHSVLRRAEEYLLRGEGGVLSSRLAQLDSTVDEIALLRELERITIDHGLVELQSTLQTLIERAASPRLEIGVFGRVSAGKSSLLNWWLERQILPTGVTPVTAVPTRIVSGEPPLVRIRTAWARTETVGLEQLAHFVTEEGNPDNSREVLEVSIQVPAKRLLAGVCLVDTPGLGSLATRGASQTLEYLPRCDLAVLLIEAGGVITREDLEVARAVIDAGSELVVTLSKADRLSAGELKEARAYAERKFQEALNVSLEISPISTLESQSDLVTTWYEKVIAPHMADARERAAAALKRKIGVLRESVMALLAMRLQQGAVESASHLKDGDASALSERLSGARVGMAEGREEFLEVLARVPRCTEDLLGSAAQALAAAWDAGEDGHAAAAQVESVLTMLAVQIGTAVHEPLGRLVAALQKLLQESEVKPAPDEGLPSPRGRPVFDATFVTRRMGVNKPPGGPRIGMIRRFAARTRVDRTLRPAIAQQLSLYAQALRVWGVRYLDELSTTFDALVARSEGADRARSGTSLTADAVRSTRSDLEMLRQWAMRPATSATAASGEKT